MNRFLARTEKNSASAKPKNERSDQGRSGSPKACLQAKSKFVRRSVERAWPQLLAFVFNNYNTCKTTLWAISFLFNFHEVIFQNFFWNFFSLVQKYFVSFTAMLRFENSLTLHSVYWKPPGNVYCLKEECSSGDKRPHFCLASSPIGVYNNSVNNWHCFFSEVNTNRQGQRD